MFPRVATSLHELVFAMDAYADSVLRDEHGVNLNLLTFLSPLADDTLDVTRLAVRLRLTKAAVSKRVPQLERDGWVVTSSDPAHRRRVLINLTAKGERLVDEARGLLEQSFATAFGVLGDLDLAALDDDLRRMVAHLHSLLEQPAALGGLSAEPGA